MRQIGFSLIDKDGNEATAFADLPGIFTIPGTSDRVMGAEAGWQHEVADGDWQPGKGESEDDRPHVKTGWRLVERWQDGEPPDGQEISGQAVRFDGDKVVVTPSFAPSPAEEPARDPIAEIDSLRAALIDKGVIKEADLPSSMPAADGISEKA